MTFHAGTRLGSYEIVALIGTGGMGEVYRATDSNLRRSVAIKVLPDAFAQDADRLARFEREAGILAALNHPNIAQIHSFERADAANALVMELVEGPTLADRLIHGPIPVDEAVPIAAQIAEALEAAHERGIVHRDLKPANIKLRADGVVKVLDFGLAKALDPQAGSAEAGQSPTITSPAMTRAGVILGTASYMSPEQARGLAVDRGADVWAWGCVLFEMLAGKRPFAGADTTEVIAAIVRGEPDWSLLPAATPVGVRRVLRRCLEKDRKRRFADIRDARFALADAQSEPASASVPAAAFRMERLAWAAALVVVAAGAGALLWRARSQPVADSLKEMRFEITTPPTTDFVSMAISPDGEKLVFVASSNGRPMLWLRSLVTGETRTLPGTDGSSFPFWKPDSRSIGFFTNRRLYRIDVDGGGLRELASVPVSAGGTWSRNGDILFTLVPDGPIFRVPEGGGGSTQVPGYAAGHPGNRFPQFLPDGRRFLYYVAGGDVRGVYVGTLDGPERRHLFDADAAAVFVPPAQWLFVRAGTLYAQRADPATFQREGEPVRIAGGIAIDGAGAAAVSASADGVVAYRTGSANRLRQLMWVDHSGAPVGVAFPPDPGNLMSISLSSDGRQLAGNRSQEGNFDIWVLDVERPGAFIRVTTGQAPDIAPIWSFKRDRLVYASYGDGGFDLWESPPTSNAVGAVLFKGPAADIPLDWSRDGRFLLYGFRAPSEHKTDIFALPLDGDRTPIPVATTDADETAGAFSPDGTWLAIESELTGTAEIYLQRFPGPSAPVPASTGGGISPTWGPSGKEIFYIAPNGQLMAVSLDFDSGGGVKPAAPRKLFPTRVGSGGASTREYVISPDGKRFLMNTLVEQTGSPITVILRASTSSPETASR